MKLRAVPVFGALLFFVACNSVTVVPIDDQDAGDGGAATRSPVADAAADTTPPVDATHADAGTDAATSDASDASDDG